LFVKSRSSKSRRLTGVYLRGKVFWYRYSHAGHQHRLSLDTEDEADAIARAVEIHANPELADINHLKLEIKDYIRHQFDSGNFTRNSVANRTAVLNKWADHLGATEVRTITTGDLQDWYQWLKSRQASPLTESTAHSYLLMVCGFFNHLVKMNKVRENPAIDVETAKLERSVRREFCDAALTQKLLNECKDQELRFVLFCGFQAGLRKEEIIQARPSWFDLDQGLLHVVHSADWTTKDKDERTIPLTKAFHDFLRNEMCGPSGLPAPFIIAPNKTQGRARYRYDFRKPFEMYMAAQKCAWVTPHVMRHTFASLLASHSVSIYKIAKWLGDGVEVTQKHYAHLLPKDADIEKGFA
jgi:integrase